MRFFQKLRKLATAPFDAIGQSGLTLIEIFVALAIIGMFSAATIESLKMGSEQAAKAKQNGQEYDLKQRILARFDCDGSVSANSNGCAKSPDWQKAVLRSSACGDVSKSLFNQNQPETNEIRSACRNVAGVIEFNVEFYGKLSNGTPGWKPATMAPIRCSNSTQNVTRVFPNRSDLLNAMLGARGAGTINYQTPIADDVKPNCQFGLSDELNGKFCAGALTRDAATQNQACIIALSYTDGIACDPASIAAETIDIDGTKRTNFTSPGNNACGYWNAALNRIVMTSADHCGAANGKPLFVEHKTTCTCKTEKPNATKCPIAVEAVQ